MTEARSSGPASGPGPDLPSSAFVCGYVLVGGRSSRFGSDKALHTVKGRPMALIVADAIQELLGDVTLVGDPAVYSGLGVPVIADATRGAGPLGGIVAALNHARSPWCLVAGCDMPRAASAPFGLMLREAARSRADAVVPRTPDGRLQPLLALYAKRAAGPLSQALRDGTWKLSEALESISCHELPVKEQVPFLNVNRVGDLTAID